MLDHDPRPGEARTAEEIDAISCAAVPEIAAVQRVWVPSSSAFIYDAEGRELIGRGGWRLYLAVDDASRIPDVGALIYQALWKAGYGYVSVTSSGAILDRSIVDASVWQPERLDFAASPILGPGLERRAPAPLILPGEPMLRTAGLKLDMSMPEWRKTSVQLASAKATAKPEAEKARKAFIRDRIAEYKRRGTYSKHVKSVFNEAVINRKLRADFELVTENGDRVTVKQVLADPARYAGMRFADPLEPNYRDDRRIAYVSLGHDPCLYSHAHGGIRYRLCNQTDEVKVVAGERARVVDETVDIMQHRGDLFEPGGGLVQVVGQNIHPMDEPKLSYYLNSIIIYLKAYEVKDGFEWLPIDVQPPVVKEVLAKLIWGLRELLHVITAPTLRTDGTILCEPGYDEKTGLMLVGQNFPPIAARPAEWQLRLAWETLWRPISEFPFATRQDRGVMVAAILTALVRHLFPTAPGFNFDAPVAGTGKTLLASFIQALCGMQPSAIPQTKDEEEMRKRLTSVLRAGDPAILLDNIRGDFSSATLEALITSQVFKDRELGGNKMLSLPTSVMILLSGNNLRLGGDLYRRVLTCRIDAKTETPERRSFALEPVQYCIEHRQALVAAGLTLLRGFIAAGSPRDTYAGGKLGSFERWDGLIRQCVLWLNREGIAELGGPDPLRRTREG